MGGFKWENRGEGGRCGKDDGRVGIMAACGNAAITGDCSALGFEEEGDDGDSCQRSSFLGGNVSYSKSAVGRCGEEISLRKENERTNAGAEFNKFANESKRDSVPYIYMAIGTRSCNYMLFVHCYPADVTGRPRNTEKACKDLLYRTAAVSSCDAVTIRSPCTAMSLIRALCASSIEQRIVTPAPFQ